MRSSIPSPLTSPATETESPKLPLDALMIRNPVVPFRVERLRFAANPPALPNTTYAPFCDPTMRSSMLSPLISPAPETDVPALENAAAPVIRKPLAPVRLEALKVAANPPALPNTTYAAPELLPFVSAPQAPTMTSSKPSPLMSPADETDQPVWSSCTMPFNWKPLAPFRVERLRFAVYPLALPNTTYAAPATLKLPPFLPPVLTS